jgi:hypothetical protein
MGCRFNEDGSPEDDLRAEADPEEIDILAKDGSPKEGLLAEDGFAEAGFIFE